MDYALIHPPCQQRIGCANFAYRQAVYHPTGGDKVYHYIIYISVKFIYNPQSYIVAATLVQMQFDHILHPLRTIAQRSHMLKAVYINGIGHHPHFDILKRPRSERYLKAAHGQHIRVDTP